ncbi:MAG: hypothetical protein R3C59_05095 [Planctomycetaceae bacterium]
MQPPIAKERGSLRSLLPGSIISLCVHAAILVFAGMSLKGCDQGAPMAAGGQDFREIGLAFVNDNSSQNTDQPTKNPQDTDSQQTPVPDAQPEPPVVPAKAPSVSELLNPNRVQTPPDAAADSTLDLSNTIGPGRPIGGVPEIGGGLADLIRPQGTSGTGAAGSLTPGPGETSFMNIVGNGRSFVYVIDTSSSMSHGRRLDLAKSQLKGSLRLLRPNQKFQVLFYNSGVTPMRLRRRAAEDMYAAEAVLVGLAEDEIDRETASSGTEHLPAIERALMLAPDVIYFLTDGAQPSLTKEDLQQVRRNNRSKAQIHVIEFASGPRESRHVSWLQQLADQSGGEYRYVPVN